jgi:hypothetical protein
MIRELWRSSLWQQTTQLSGEGTSCAAAQQQTWSVWCIADHKPFLLSLSQN